MPYPSPKPHPPFIHDQGISILVATDLTLRRRCLDPQLLRPLRRTTSFYESSSDDEVGAVNGSLKTLDVADLESHWKLLPDRNSLLSGTRNALDDISSEPADIGLLRQADRSSKRLCIASDAGMGKSKLIEWFLWRLNSHDSSSSGTIALKIDLSDLERSWKTRQNQPSAPTFGKLLMEYIANRFLNTFSTEEYQQSTFAQTSLETLFTMRAKEGNLTLIADGLDQVSDQSDLLSQFLGSTDPAVENLQLIVAGRSNAILSQWAKVFSNPTWVFVRVEPFTHDQQCRYLGWLPPNMSPPKSESRFSKIPHSARDILSIPRVLEYLLEIDDYSDIRTASDVYANALSRMVHRGLENLPTESKASPGSILELLARQAFQCFNRQLDKSLLTMRDGVNPSDASADPPRYLYNTNFKSESTLREFKDHVKRSMSSDLQNEFTKAWDAVQKINQFLYYGIFDQTTGHSSNSFSMIWANRSLHEFLLAYYFANYATSEESRYLWDWIYLPDRNETDQYYPFWQFLCEMPPAHCNAAVWLRSIEVLYWPTIPRANALPSKYSLTSDYPYYAKRSNEMIYRSWEQLGFYADDKNDPEMKAQAHAIRERWWGEFEGIFLNGEYGSELQATAKEITEHLLLIPAGKVTLGTSPERQEIRRYLAAGKQKLDEFRDEAKVEEYFAKNPFYQKRAGTIEEERMKQKLKAILKEDYTEEAIFEFLEAFFGVTFVSNPELEIDAFKLGRQTISNAWYRLYNPRHTQIWSGYEEYSGTLAHPAVVISFFDAWAYSKWLRWDGQSCRLPWEAEWEYAAKVGFPSWKLEYWWEGMEHLENPDRAFTKSRINCNETTDKKPSNQNRGCTVIPDPSRASPGSKKLDLGPEGRNSGLMDMQGNTWEWCQDKQRSDYLDKAKTTEFPVQEQQHREDSLACDASVSRVLRGGSFYDVGRGASASFRTRSDPTYSDFDYGFRVARAP